MRVVGRPRVGFTEYKRPTMDGDDDSSLNKGYFQTKEYDSYSTKNPSHNETV